nr:MAG TPA: hypothetical protein [Caudoviricetes sp.]
MRKRKAADRCNGQPQREKHERRISLACHFSMGEGEKQEYERVFGAGIE